MNLSEFLSRLKGVTKGSGNQYYAKCPAHEDQHASLSVSEGDDGRILLKCHVGCTPQEIVSELGLTINDLFSDDKTAPASKPEIVARYNYTDIDGNLLNQKTRFSDKSFSWSHKENGKWTRGHKGNPVLYTTRLTDLIYQGFAAQQPINRFSSDRNTPDMESLAKDLFAALYSPILRRKDEDSVKLKERMLSKPLFEKIVGSGYFNELKGLCEDKELPSYDAVSAFCNVLVRDFPAIDTPELRYLDVIEQLTMQAKKAIQAIYDSRNSQKPASAKKLLFLYNRADRKLSQIECLTAKIQKAAVRWAEALEPVIDTALRAALHEAFKTHTIMEAWGSSNEEMRNIPMNQTLLNYVKNSKQLQEIARLLGRYRELIADKRKNSYSYGRGEKYDLTTGNDITNCLSSELALLGMAETEILFMRRYEQKRLMQYRKRTAVVKGRGDMIVLIDESGSTRSVAGWAKALALALLDIASRDGRKFAMVHFASADRIRTDLFEPGHYTPEDVMKAAEQFFGGGTNFEAPLKEALRLMENGYENADIIPF